MIQFNLLPDVKLQFIKAQRRKRLVMTISFVATAVSLVIFISLLSYVRVGQKGQLSDLSKNIADNTKKLQDTKDLNKILTIQNQLQSLPNLHNQKVISSRLFDYLTQLTPTQATISDASFDFVANTVTLKGNAGTLPIINQFADTLKFTQFPKKNSQGKFDNVNAFSGVVLKSFTVAGAAAATNKGLGYQLDFTFDPAIFANVKGDATDPVPTLTIPNITSTRSETEKPGSLFEPQPQSNTEGQGQ